MFVEVVAKVGIKIYKFPNETNKLLTGERARNR